MFLLLKLHVKDGPMCDLQNFSPSISVKGNCSTICKKGPNETIATPSHQIVIETT
jgi:hypothetical protein